jgi:hypothetical protein
MFEKLYQLKENDIVKITYCLRSKMDPEPRTVKGRISFIIRREDTAETSVEVDCSSKYQSRVIKFKENSPVEDIVEVEKIGNFQKL